MRFDLVFEGGGAKGSVFVGALRELEAGRHTARRLIGTSAGAITATLMAAGVPSSKLLDAAKKRTGDGKPQFSTFMDVPEQAQLEEQGLDRSLTYAILEEVDLPWIPNMAEGLIDRSILGVLMTLGVYRQSFSFIERGGLFAGEAFRAWLIGMLDDRGQELSDGRPDPPLGQATLRSFHERTGSDLSLVASDTVGQEMLVLNHRTAPDCPVSWAVRMSMSIPFLWQEVVWHRDWGEYRGRPLEGHTIVDGGVLSNFPIHLLTSRDPEVAAIMGDTDPDLVPNLGLLIDETLEVEGAEGLEGSGDARAGKEAASGRARLSLDQLTRDTVARISRLVNTMTNSHDAPAIEAHADEVCRLPAKGYGTTEFDMSEPRLTALVRAGKNAMREYLAGRTYNLKQASRYADCSQEVLRQAMEKSAGEEGALKADGGQGHPYRIQQTELSRWMAARDASPDRAASPAGGDLLEDS